MQLPSQNHIISKLYLPFNVSIKSISLDIIESFD